MSKRNIGILLVVVCLCVILVAGCTSSTTSTTPAQNNPMQTVTSPPVPTSGLATPASSSTAPIIGKWSYTSPRGISAQVVFSADGSFAGYVNGGSQADRTGTWQSAGNNQYTVTINGQPAPVTWVYAPASNQAYNSAYPSLVYSPVSQ